MHQAILMTVHSVYTAPLPTQQPTRDNNNPCEYNAGRLNGSHNYEYAIILIFYGFQMRAVLRTATNDFEERKQVHQC